MVDDLDVGLLIVAVGAWGIAIFSGLTLLRRRRAGLSLLGLWFDGLRWFRRDTFRPEAATTWYVFIGGWAAFLACVVAVALRAALRGSLFG